MLGALAERIGLVRRDAPKRRDTIKNLPGLALRNVQEGEIVIDRRPVAASENFSESDRDLIEASLREPHERVLARAIR